ncbi:hydroquinone glucosyltransferase-like [Telopea speciosissima]|uniref:hydroquinone glucosyltransferase-like n=1 Tax=Telopea speciosissima TaxID=54955 RepID=UPI001CC5FB76|nr:hydroquinone glucosyltransferase-like [Telopea speciosissima]
MEETQKTPHIVILPAPGIGHLIPLTELAKRLTLHHNFTVTLAISTEGSPSKTLKAIVDALPKTINSLFLPPVNFDDLSEDVLVETRICLTVTRSLPSLRETFKTLTTTTHLVALVVDLFGTDAIDVAREFNVLPYIFFPSTSLMLSFVLHLPKLDEMYSCEYRDMVEPVKLPGCVPIHGSDFLDPVQDRKNEAYSWILHHSKRYHLAEGILLNSFMALEPGAIKALTEETDLSKPPVYMVGPLIQNQISSDTIDGSECLRWLDHQPQESVIFVSFGSAGVLSEEQLTELALGLELSEQRFLWVARKPTDQKAANAGGLIGIHSSEDPLGFLPEGFLERTKERGFVVYSWAPQIQVLSHGSTGGFLTHCGWNSTLESVVHGVPLIAWPLYAEQKMNSVMLVDDIKIALRPKADENGLIRRDEIAAVVKCLVEGEEGKRVSNKMKELKVAAAMALSGDGSSTQSLSEVACKWKTHAGI